ncbi:MAG: molybdopterin converting factor subunit 1 [Alphaproteobacteria bacterium]|nr:molybdopterin converting factor subunit 1 [Alphaproteobacteria bacterium]
MKVLYFAWLRARTGCAEETVSPPGDVATVGALVEWLKARSPGHAAAFKEMRVVRAAVNQNLAGLNHTVAPGDEIAFFPPMTGG